MANSGSFSTSSYKNRCVTFNWWINNQNSTENYTEIGWEFVGDGSASGFYKAGNFSLTIDNEEVYSTSQDNRIELWNGTRVAAGTKRIYHNNDGSRSFGASARAGIYYYAINVEGSGSWELTKINRYPKFTTNPSIVSRTINTITFNWGAVDLNSNIYYSTNNKDWTKVTTPNTQINNLIPNTGYTIYVQARNSASETLTTTASVSTTTYDIARITDAPNINIGQNPTIKFNNPSGAYIYVYLENIVNGVRESSFTEEENVTGKTTHTFYPNANTMYSKVQDSNIGYMRYCLVTVNDNKKYWNSVDRQYNVTNSNPTFSNFTYADTDANIVDNITGNNQTIIKGYSDVKVTISTANKAIAKNSASMIEYIMSMEGSDPVKQNYSETNPVYLQINNAKSNTITVYARDSRQNTTSKQLLISNYINYSPIKINSINLVRTDSVKPETTLNFSGYIWNGNFGKVNNSITSCSYRYRRTGTSSWTTGATTITPTKSGTSFSFSDKIQGDLGANGFDIDNSYDVQVLIADRLSNNNNLPASFVLGPGTPAMAIYKNNLAIGQRYDTSDPSKLQINGDTKIKGKLIETGIFGCRENTVQNSYVKLFTATMLNNYKSCSILFTVSDTQATNESALCNLMTRRSATNDLEIIFFNRLDYRYDLKDRLVAVSVGDSKIEIYEKMNNYDSPTVEIIGFSRLRQSDTFGKIDIDCNTVITNLPDGTQMWAVATIKSDLESTMGRLADANIPHIFENNRAHMRFFQSSNTMTANKPAGDGFVIHNSWDNASQYNAQLYLPNNISWPLQYRTCVDGNWSVWESIYRAAVLFDNSLGTAGTITLSQSASEFRFLEIYICDNNGYNHKSFKIFSPDGKQVPLSIEEGYLENNLVKTGFRTRRIGIAGKTINTINNEQFSYLVFNEVGNVYHTHENFIKITRVIGYK